jgi:hypothetical protein
MHHRGCKQQALAGVQLQSILLTLLEKDVKSCEKIIFSLLMEYTVIQKKTLMLLLMSSIMTASMDCRFCVAFLVPYSTRVGVYISSGRMED